MSRRRQQNYRSTTIEELYIKSNSNWQNPTKLYDDNPILIRPKQCLISKSLAKKLQSRKSKFTIYSTLNYKQRIIDAINQKKRIVKQRINTENIAKKKQPISIFFITNNKKQKKNHCKYKEFNSSYNKNTRNVGQSQQLKQQPEQYLQNGKFRPISAYNNIRKRQLMIKQGKRLNRSMINIRKKQPQPQNQQLIKGWEFQSQLKSFPFKQHEQIYQRFKISTEF